MFPRRASPQQDPLGALLPRPEDQLLLVAALGVAERAVPAFQAWMARVDLGDDLGWETVRLLPLACHNLQLCGVSDPVMGRLKGVYRRTWYESVGVLHRTVPAIKVLEAHGVEPEVLDGAALALTCYAPPAVRPVTRLDLLVRRREVRPALEALRQAGWRCAGEGNDDELRFADFLRLWGPEETEIRLHWRPLPGRANDDDDEPPGSSGAPLEWQGTRLTALDPTRQLARTILQGLSPGPAVSLHWVPDAVMLLRTHGQVIDWARLLDAVSAHRMTTRLVSGCRYLAEHFEIAIPGAVLAGLRRHRTPMLERIADAASTFGGPEVPSWNPRPRETLRNEFRRYLGWRRGLGNPLRALLEFSHFLRYRWGLSGRRELLPLMFHRGRTHPGASPPLRSHG